MATNLSIDSKRVDAALEVSGKKTKRAVVTLALEEFIARRRHKPLLELVGQLDWDPTFDVKTERSRNNKL